MEGGRLLKIYADVMHRMGRLIGEERGQLRPVLEKDPGKITYELVGVDMDAVERGWAGAAVTAQSEFAPVPESGPAPKAADPRHDEFALGKEEYRRRLREGEPMPSAPPPGFNPTDGEYVWVDD